MINSTKPQMQSAGNTSQSRPILQARALCEFMCTYISLFLLTGVDAIVRCPYVVTANHVSGVKVP